MMYTFSARSDALIFLSALFASCQAWTTAVPRAATRRGHWLRPSTEISYSSDNDDLPPFSSSPSPPQRSALARASVAGVSVSEGAVIDDTANTDGFYMVLHTVHGYLSLPVTSDARDRNAVTSPAALILSQLLNNIDMAGTFFAADALGRVAVDSGAISLQPSSSSVQVHHFQNSTGASMRFEPSKSKSATVAMPTVTLDELVVAVKRDDGKISFDFTLVCALPAHRGARLRVEPSKDALKRVLRCHYENDDGTVFDDDSSAAFTCMALALRYKAPIIVAEGSDTSVFRTRQEIEAQLPCWTTITELKQPATRAQRMVAAGQNAELPKWIGALNIAKQRGDQYAVEKLQQKLREDFGWWDEEENTQQTAKAAADHDDDDDDDEEEIIGTFE